MELLVIEGTAMEKLRLALLFFVTVLAWAMASTLVPERWWDLGGMPPTWWKQVGTGLAFVVLAYPLAHACGIGDRQYLTMGAVALVVVALVAPLAPATGREWITIAILLFALTGGIVTRLRRRRT